MDDTVTIHSFGNNDRSGKVRWLAHELSLPVQNVSVKLGEHRQFPYRELNPFGVIPAIEWRGETLIESTAICTFIAEQFPESGLIVLPTEEARSEYLQWLSIIADSMETKLVEYYLAGVGLYPPETKPLFEKTLQFKLRILLEKIPQSGFLVANRLTLADITLAYSLRLALSSGLIEYAQVKGYLEPLIARPAAIECEFFKSAEQFIRA
jgi:glutathione S-transferase